MVKYCPFILLVWFVGVDAVCEDLNTAACSLFLSNKPDLCTDPTLSASCKRFCGLCPLECYNCASAVDSPDDCNATSTCALGEVCMRKTHSNPDGSMEYILSCESKTTCEGLGFGFHGFVGKRDADHERSRRDISFHCCDVDRCNYPDEFTTTVTMPSTTTTTVRTTTLKPLHNCSRDIVFILDGSTTIGSRNHQFMKQFVQNVIGHLHIGPMDSQVAMIEYSDIARVEWYLTDHTTAADLQSAVKNIPYVTGNTSTHAAFYLARNSVLTPRHGDRPNAKDVVIVITDGGTTVPDLAVNEAVQLINAGVEVVAIGVGSNVDQKELQQYVQSGHSYTVNSFNSLPVIAANVASNTCQ